MWNKIKINNFEVETLTPDNLKITEQITWRNYYHSKFENVSKILKQRLEGPTVKIRDLIGERHVYTYGIIDSVFITKNGNLFIELSDTTGQVKCILSKSNPQFKEFSQILMPEDIIAIEGTYNKDTGFLFIDKIILPEIFLSPRAPTVSGEILFIGDLHFGSKFTNLDKISRFIQYVKEKSKDIKAIVINGDLLDGIGVYPEQEKEQLVLEGKLLCSPILQAEFMKKVFLDNLPVEIPIFILPGNHEVPFVPSVYPQYIFQQMSLPPNIHFVSNPSWLNIGGISILLYHGNTLVSMATRVGIKISELSKVVTVTLRKRHLGCSQGDRQAKIMPSEEDYLYIHKVPDIVVVSHTHMAFTSEYKNIKIVNPGTFQGATPYTIRMGVDVTPPSFARLSLSTKEVEIVTV